MKRILLFFIASGIQYLAFAQDAEWAFIRRDNTGIGGQLHYVVRGDDFNNIWTGGYTSTTEEGSLVRIGENSAVYTNWETYNQTYLPNGLIYDIEFDETGIIWVATANGLATSGDGTNWDHYDTSNTALLSDKIGAITISQDNHLWAVCKNENLALEGIGHFDGTNWEYFTSSNSEIPSGSVLRDVTSDANNVKWIASNAGLIRFDGTAWTIYTTSNSGLGSNDILELAIDDQNRINALTAHAIHIFDGENWIQISSSEWGDPAFIATSIYIREGKIILTGNNEYNTLIFDGNVWEEHYINFTPYDCFIDHDGNFWTSGYGVVNRFNGESWQRYTSNNTGLPTNFNEDIFIDSQNRKWFANGNGGIQVFDCPRWEVYGPDNEGLFPNPQPLYQTTIGTSITEDSDGDIWFTYDGTSGYAVQIPGGNYQDYDSWIIWHIENSHPSFQSALEVESTDNGLVFIRSYNQNLFMFDKSLQTWTMWDMTNALTTPPTCMRKAPNGKMYVGHYQGIDIYDNGSWSNMDLSAVGIEHIQDIRFDGNNTMWLATTQGLWKFDGTNWTNWNEDNSNIAANYVTSIDVSPSDNSIYLSAHNTQTWPYYGGISYFDGTAENFTTLLSDDSPLAHKQVEDIALDQSGNIWALTQSEGFSIYNPAGIQGFECIDRTLERTLGVTDYTDNATNGIAYPNPTTGFTTLVWEAKNSGFASITVFDLSGRTVKTIRKINSEVGINQITLDLSSLEKGIYFCRINSGDEFKNIKVIKN